ncbi:hypothetical protein AAW14_20775 [Streptomyces hygroscopicus]|uniref:ATP-binding protein n=1 Tax=Streptomyces hygroscopicus TaxID=1912 RepID=UPI00223F0DEF|nr:ATP-binding protein [Streptomyces hygroscopicus]MCW7944396.1 hypothetical protein [Streptomyces hygroscopicus]
MAERPADRFARARTRGFVGRRRETAAFTDLLAAGAGAVVFVYGPGGIGKTTLLHHFADLGAEAGRSVTRLRADELGTAFGGVEGLADTPRALVTVDGVDGSRASDRLLLEQLVGRIGEDAVLVLAGREAPPLVWRTDPAWLGLLHTMRLGPLPVDDGVELLRLRGVPDGDHERLLDFTHGHPLALALVADVRAQGGVDPLSPAASPEVVGVLLDALLDTVPTQMHRRALEACAQVLVTTEPLLAALLQVPDARGLFYWLRDLSVVEYNSRGIHPHDMIRELLDSELRWRHPEQRVELRRRASSYYEAVFSDGGTARQRAVLTDFAYLHRGNPLVGPLLTHVAADSSQALYLDMLSIGPAAEEDVPALLAMATQHEGPASARLLAAWWGHPAGAWHTVRGPEAEPVGFCTVLTLGTQPPDGAPADPAVEAACDFLRGSGTLRTQESALMVRSWMSRDDYQAVSPVQTLITLRLTHHYLTTDRPALTLLSFADPEFWTAGCAYADFTRLPEADFSVGGRHHGVFLHDWRRTPALTWLALLSERESAADPLRIPPPDPAGPPRIIEREEFAAGVREALRGFGRAGGMRDCALLGSRLVTARAGAEANPRDRAEALRQAIRDAAAVLAAAPHDRRAHRALHHTYIQPASTQQRAAELLDLPMTTYRRHLSAGIQRLTEELWQQEVDLQ